MCTIDHRDGDLHTLIFKFYMWEYLRVGIKVEIKMIKQIMITVGIKIIQYVCIHNLFHYTPPFLLGLTID